MTQEKRSSNTLDWTGPWLVRSERFLISVKDGQFHAWRARPLTSADKIASKQIESMNGCDQWEKLPLRGLISLANEWLKELSATQA